MTHILGNTSSTTDLDVVTGIYPWLFDVKDRQFGAVGDGVADDTAAIQTAIDTAWASATIGTTVIILLPRGIYRVTSAIIFYPYIRIIGAAQNYSRIVVDPTGDFTNGPISSPFVFKYWGGGDAWWHGGTMECFGIDLQDAPVGGIHGLAPGENSKIDLVRVNNAGSIPRTVSDAVTNSTNTVNSATAAFTDDDVNALVSGDMIPTDTKIDQVISATQVIFNKAATGSGSGGSLTINRPIDAVVFDSATGGAATGLIGSLNGSTNSGALLRLTNQVGGCWSIESLSGDDNNGGLLRISNASAGADPTTITVLNIKCETDTYNNSPISMDPVILLDKCDMVCLNILGGSFANSSGARDVIRIDQPVMARGGPSLSLQGIEGANPFNTQYDNIIHDSSTGEVISSTPLTGGWITSRHIYPNIIWGRDLLIGGGGTIPAVQPWHHILPFFSDPDVVYNGATWQIAQNYNAFWGVTLYNLSNLQNDGGAWKVNLARGTWKLNFMSLLASNQAIATIDISFDNGTTWTAIGTADLYGSGSNRFVFPGIVVPTDGDALVRFSAPTRNGSSTGWVLSLSGMEWTRTA